MPLSRDEATFNEGSIRSIYFQIFQTDKHGTKTPVHLDAISTLVLDYFLTSSGAAINSRSDQDVKNTNNVTISGLGEVKWTLQALDTTVQGSLADGKLEQHTAVFKWTLANGSSDHVRQDIWIKTETFV